VSLRLLHRRSRCLLHQLDAVAEGVEEREARDAGERGFVSSPNAALLKVSPNLFDPLDLEGRVSLRRRDRVLDADMELNVRDFVPHPAVTAEHFRLLYLFESEQPAVELTRLRFSPARDADLYVVESFDVDLHGKEKELPRGGFGNSRDVGLCSNAARFGKPVARGNSLPSGPGSRPTRNTRRR